jgi:hypothetical protein
VSSMPVSTLCGGCLQRRRHRTHLAHTDHCCRRPLLLLLLPTWWLRLPGSSTDPYHHTPPVLTSWMMRPFLSRTALVLYMLRRRTCSAVRGKQRSARAHMHSQASTAPRGARCLPHRGGIALALGPFDVRPPGIIAVLWLLAGPPAPTRRLALPHGTLHYPRACVRLLGACHSSFVLHGSVRLLAVAAAAAAAAATAVDGGVPVSAAAPLITGTT